MHNLESDITARPDLEREARKGVPEIILTDTKTIEQSLSIAATLLEKQGRAILSRVSDELHVELGLRFGDAIMAWAPAARMAVIRDGEPVVATGGVVGVVTAGTSDQPAAEEAAVVARELGCQVHVYYDVGVAGLHRLFGPLEELMERASVDAIVVAAGMDGALPSVVSGLVSVPVIGLPTSVGYGFGGGGQAALMSMLQTCSPGLAVVNIDNGVGAGIMAGLIANRVASARRGA